MDDRDAMDRLLESDACAQALGIRRVAAPEGAIVAVSMTVEPVHLPFLEVLHGGVVFSLADCAMSLASNAAQTALAIVAHVSLAAPGRVGDTLTAEAFEVTAGSTLATYRVPVIRSDGRVLASFHGTVYRPPS